MNKTIDSLAKLYIKIMSGTASEEEKATYEMEIAISCIREDILTKAIRQKASELEQN